MASKDLRDSRRDGFNEGPKDSTLSLSHKSLVLGVPLDGEHVFTPRQVNRFDCLVFRGPWRRLADLSQAALRPDGGENSHPMLVPE